MQSLRFNPQHRIKTSPVIPHTGITHGNPSTAEVEAGGLAQRLWHSLSDNRLLPLQQGIRITQKKPHPYKKGQNPMKWTYHTNLQDHFGDSPGRFQVNTALLHDVSPSPICHSGGKDRENGLCAHVQEFLRQHRKECKRVVGSKMDTAENYHIKQSRHSQKDSLSSVLPIFYIVI